MTPTEPTARSNASRTSFLTRLTQFPSKPVSVVPYAPERLSITQDVLTPTMQEALITAQNNRHSSLHNSMRNSVLGSLVGDKGDPTNGNGNGNGNGNAAVHGDDDDSAPAKDGGASGNTLFAAIKMRRALQRAKAGRNSLQHEPKVESDAQANITRHNKVLARYKIRRVDITVNETTALRNLKLLMVNPHSTVFKMWQLSTLIIIIYQSIILPYSLAFGWNQSSTVDLATNTVFFIDIIIAFNTPVAATDDESEYITDRAKIALIYLKGWLFFDVLACTPFDTLLVWINNYDDSSTASTNLNVLGLLKALRIPRLLRLVRLLRVVKVLKIRPEIRRWLQYSRHANLLRLVRLVLSFLVVNHYVACIWYGTVASDAMKSQETDQSTSHMYIVSFYITLLVIMGQNITLFTDAEYIFCIAAMLLGAVLMAVVFGNVAILIANYYENQSTHQKKMEWLFASMTRMKLPMDLQNRINDYYQAMWDRHGTLDGAVTAFIPELSRNLAYEVELFLRMDMINRAPIFQSCSAKVVQELVMELELQVFMPGDYIVVRGEVGNDMYFVQNGLCQVTKDITPAAVATESFQQTMRRGTVDTTTNEIILKSLGQGDYFGEIALLMNCKRTANVRAQVFSELCALTREVFESISVRYLEDRNIIEKFIMDKYDPGMLQAAMKQSQELAMRASGGGNSSSAAMGGAPRRSFFKNASTPGLDSDSSSFELLRRIDDRLQKLELRIDRDSQERRDAEIRLSTAGPRLSTHSEHNHGGDSASPVAGGAGSRNNSASGSAAGFVLFEPERMSQRHLHLLPISRGSATGSQITQVDGGGDLSVQGVDDGEGTEQHADQKRNVWRRPSVHRSGSWRNARREGSADSLRLRGLVKPQAATTIRHSSRAASVTAAIAAAEVVSVSHSSLRQEPSLRSATSERGGLDDSFGGADPDREMLLSADTLDDLASAFAQNEQAGGGGGDGETNG